ncbi:hypothetical protein GBAR_LOCUS4308, partial [Geodia barretti]
APLRSIPSLLEYFSYNFNFHSILIGPGYTIREHLAFMDGSNLTPLDNPNQFARAKEHSKEPSTLIPVAKKSLLSLIYMAAYLYLGNYPHRTLLGLLISRVSSFQKCPYLHYPAYHLTSFREVSSFQGFPY